MARAATILLALLTGLAPLALGSDRPLPWAYNACLAGVIAIMCAFVILSSDRHNLRFGLVALPLVLWSMALAWAVLQIVPINIPGLPHPLWGLASNMLGVDLDQSLSVNRFETLASLLRLLTYLLVFLSAFILSRDVDRAAFLLRAFTIFASLYAVYGLLRFATATDKLLWFDQPHAPELTATFVNRNTAATYFGMASVVALAFLLRRIRRLMNQAQAETTLHAGLERIFNGFAGPLIFELACFVLLLTATMLTQSRGGVSATVAAIMAVLLFTWFRRLWTGGYGSSLAVLAVLLASLAVLQMSGTLVLTRMIETDNAHEERLHVFSDTLTAISDHAAGGSGLGTFQDVFPLYRSATEASDAVWDRAHNDYLEALLGLGIPAGMALIFGIAAPILANMRGIFTRRRNSHLPMAGAAAGLLAGIHASLDFSLQVQAVAMTLALLLGTGVAQSVSDRHR